MTDTVTRLLALADDYALRNYHHDDPDNREAARQALHDELVRLFTPLSDEQVATVYFGATGQHLRPQDNVLAHKFAKAIQQQHGIGGES